MQQTTIYFITLDDVLHIHQQQMTHFGGLQGIRDHKLLESALAMPYASFDGVYLHADMFEMAAVYFFHIIKNHPFIDGNKRTGVVTSLTFLLCNDVVIDIPHKILYKCAIDVATSHSDKEVIVQMFRSYSQEID